MRVEEDGDDVGFTTFDYGCTVCLPTFVDGKPVRQRIEPRGKWMCCVKCGASYGETSAGVEACADCHGTGEVFGHADDCDDDLCALNGDEHSCTGKVERCHCASGVKGPEHG